ncbi:hypothetical protein [Flaviflexus equikiangi]|uniref:hypothetical protein n=1 Tax=Flaviflexus equikiangi TaxID=2758573 RepID=UPI0015F439D7|nr:hypothetical protein [Flaviflexus equikiangi]
MISTRFAATVLAGLLALSACGDTSETDSTATSRALGAVESETTTVSEPGVTVTRPAGWYEVEPQDGFAYQYLWSGNDWDDVLAQYFETSDYEFSSEFFIDLLDSALGDTSTLEVREVQTEFAGYPAIIIDIVYTSGSYTSLTYVNVDDRLWEFTVNSQTPEGLRRGEKINSTAIFTP